MNLSSAQQKLQGELTAAFPGLAILFRPPQHHTLTYPCVVYDYSSTDVKHANNDPYKVGFVFNVTFLSSRFTVFDTQPVLKIKSARHSSTFTNDDIVNETYTITIS